MINSENIIELRNVSIDYKLKKYSIHAVRNCSLDIKKNCITALVGESGSGKTTLASSIIDCISSPGVQVGGTIEYDDGKDNFVVNELSEKRKQSIRWSKISMVFQAAQSALNPIMTVWDHFYETYRAHDKTAGKEDILARAKQLLEYVKLDVNRVLTSYPHELSGGMKQRVMIAFALLLNPSVMILDEPTTALDVITQNYIFNILRDINKNMGVAMLLMTHDINVVAKFSDYVGIMYAGQIMEVGKTGEVFLSPRHPYTEGLLNATPSLSRDDKCLKSIAGNPPDLRNLPAGCAFAPRCPYASDYCAQEPCDTVTVNRTVKCHRTEESKNDLDET